VLARCESRLQAEGRHFEHPSSFVVGTVSVISSNDEKYSQFGGTGGLKSSQFVGCFAGFVGRTSRRAYKCRVFKTLCMRVIGHKVPKFLAILCKTSAVLVLKLK